MREELGITTRKTLWVVGCTCVGVMKDMGDGLCVDVEDSDAKKAERDGREVVKGRKHPSRSRYVVERERIFLAFHLPVYLHPSKSPNPSFLAYSWLLTNSSSLHMSSSPAPQNSNGCLASFTKILTYSSLSSP